MRYRALSAVNPSLCFRHSGRFAVTCMLLASALLSSCAHMEGGVKASPIVATSQATVVYIVRHAEKLPDKNDPELSAKGRQRALALAFSLHHEDVDALYSSNYRRTVQTLTPLSTSKALDIERYDAGDSAALVRQVLANHVGQRVVIAGHSNTVPEIVCLFTAPSASDCADVGMLDHNDYDRLFVVLHGENTVETLKLSY